MDKLHNFTYTAINFSKKKRGEEKNNTTETNNRNISSSSSDVDDNSFSKSIQHVYMWVCLEHFRENVQPMVKKN